MNLQSFTEKHSKVTELIQKEFERNANKYGGKIKCRKGCSQCCTQIFKITQTDAFVIKKYLNELHPDEKIHFKEKAEKYFTNLNQENLNTDLFFSKHALPCPALSDEGACMIYEARPVICRRFGPPVYDYKNPVKLFACELNFENGEEIIDEELIPNQTLIGKKWDELKTEFNEENNVNENASTTIAEAILNSDSLD